jgi:two-component system, NtrC family, response regulator AtoC
MSHTVLIVEDDVAFATNVRDFLLRHAWDVHVVTTAEDALAMIDEVQPDIVLCDQRLPGMSGAELLPRVLAGNPHCKVLMITGDDSAQTAVGAMKAGAYDYLTKPVVLAELKMLLDKAIGVVRLEQVVAVHQERQARGSGLAALIGESSVMQHLKSMIRQILEAEKRMSDADLPALLINGETGTGKELVARALHFDGVRRDGPFVEINCASIPSHLLEAELFGHEKGAFTDAKERRMGLVESADGGTLFLDEVGEIDLLLQAKLLKLLEERTVRRIGAVKERKVNLRIISATNRDLQQMVREGTFRSDLYYRLRILTLKVPSLRERGDDALALARHYLALHGRRYGKPNLGFTPAAEHALARHFWPGNVRELRNMLEQSVLLATGEWIGPEQLGIGPSLQAEASSTEDAFLAAMPAVAATLPAGATLADVEREIVVRTLEKTDWNVSKSAKLLGTTRDVLRYRIEKFALSRPAARL